jgi:hypothetical protein
MCKGVVGHQWNFNVVGPRMFYVCRECGRSAVRERRLSRYFNTRTPEPPTGGVIQIDTQRVVGAEGPYLNIPAFLRRNQP